MITFKKPLVCNFEGMASGLPVIVSDWNGYKSTVRNNVDGFKIPTYSLDSKSGEQIAYNHMMGFINYDHTLVSYLKGLL